MKKEETLDHHIKATWHAISRMYNQQAAKFGGTMSVGYVLLNINSEEGTAATKIAPQMGLEARSLTRLLKSMEEKKLIYRAPDPNDRRGVRIFLTNKGVQMKNKARETVLQFNNVMREMIPESKLDAFFDVLASVNQAIEQEIIYEPVSSVKA
ncbi:MAG: MarR family winged helix-turn-helix transcriptional regulator [Cyclobacteriaceae bacterium]